MGKGGQVSVFIIIGIFLVALLILVLALFGDNMNLLLNQPDSITSYTEECLEQVARGGVDLMALQGGYIILPKITEYDPKSYIDAGFKVPHWYYGGRNMKPTIPLMEQELAGYIEEFLPFCLNEYQEFPSYTIKKVGNMSADVTITHDEIDVKLNSPMQINEPGGVETLYMEEFHADFKSKFGKFYSLASELMDWENLDYYLENYTDEMIASSDWLPYEGIEIGCKPRMFRVSQMKDYTQTMVMHNLNFLMFENTDYTETGIPYYDKQYKIDFTDNDYRDISVKVIYQPDWGMDYEVIPSKNGVAKPYEFKLAEYIPTCVKIYHHKYTLDYPVLFQLADEENRFYFGSPVILRRSIPNRYNEVRPWPSEYNEVGNDKYCSNASSISLYGLDQNGRITVTPSIRSNRKNSLNVYAQDAHSGIMLPNVNISYHCVSFLCDIGSTTFPRQEGLLTGADPMLEAQFPNCNNGFVIGETSGYQRAREQVTVSDGTDGIQALLEMYPLKQFGYTIKVVEEHNGLLSIRDMLYGESIYMVIRNEEMDFEEQIIYPSDSEYFTNLTLMLGSFTYDLDVKLVNNNSFLGGSILNWTVSSQDAETSTHILFYVLRKDPIYPPQSDEEWEEVYKFATENAKDYPPEIR